MEIRCAYQRPWTVHESVGPVAGSVSQNWVWRSCPPGALKQQRSETEVVFWHDNGVLLVTGQLFGPAATRDNRPAPAARVRIADMVKGENGRSRG